ncbi:hypothetical protein GCM10023149_24470 [Mucilaginibacter gynuensis]|uniref:Uncharacterized protein n=1 Tax=Mucilaginibacter gynuensis TaxID=1302236 RepID=A0ABP8GFJ6_9SPHI
MNLFFFGGHAPTHKDNQEGDKYENIGDPNFDESLDQGAEYMDDSLRMIDQPLGDN